MEVIVVTKTESQETPPAERVIDLALTGNWKWLRGHLKWAMRTRNTVTITPKL